MQICLFMMVNTPRKNTKSIKDGVIVPGNKLLKLQSELKLRNSLLRITILIMTTIFLTLWKKSVRRYFPPLVLQKKEWKFWFKMPGHFPCFISTHIDDYPK